jgi:hypothetical protein
VRGVDAGEDDVHTPAGKREPVLDEHLDIAQPSVDEVMCKDRQAAVPRAHLGVRDPKARRMTEVFGDADSQRAIQGQRGQTSGGVAKRRHGRRPPGSTKSFVRVGACSAQPGARRAATL